MADDKVKLHVCAESKSLLPIFGRQLKKVAGLGDQAELFLHSVFDDLCGRGHGFAQFGPAHELNPVVLTWKDFVSLAVGLNLTSDQITSDLQTCGLAEDYVTLTVRTIDARRVEAKQALKSAASSISSNSLTDFDWSMRLVLSSDKVSSMHEPVLLLRLNSEGEGKQSEATVELTKADLDRLLAACASVQQVLDRLQA